MSDVGDVYYLSYLVSAVFQGFSQDIGKNIRAEISDMRVVVDGRPAIIHTNRSFSERGEYVFFSRKRIVEFYYSHFL